jgi:hypothetical protein
MKTYFTFIDKALSACGLQLTQKERKFDWFLRILSMTTVFVASVQCMLFIFTANEIGMLLASAFTIGFFSIQACFKFFSIWFNFEKLKQIKVTLDELTETLKVREDSENVKKLNQFRKYTKLSLMMNVTCIWIFNLKPIFDIIAATSVGKIADKNLIFAFYYPSKRLKTDFFYPKYLYEIIAGHILTAVPLTADGFFLLLAGQVACIYRTIGEVFRQTIDEFEASKRSETVNKLKSTIDIHNQVFAVSSELLKIYEIALLASALLQTGTICFIAFIVSVSRSG